MKVTSVIRIELEKPELTREEAEELYQQLGAALGKGFQTIVSNPITAPISGTSTWTPPDGWKINIT